LNINKDKLFIYNTDKKAVILDYNYHGFEKIGTRITSSLKNININII
jgi:hypothetical protein